MSVEDTLVKMAEDRNPPDCLTGFLWVSKRQPKRSTARHLAALAVKTWLSAVDCPKFKAIEAGPGFWRGVVYAGRRSRREAAKEKA